ncbi:MAG: hypothetical protein JW760_02460 [Spirochaetales bacterium]|nr:hypothetical protein [Spirochaetales bacterium]
MSDINEIEERPVFIQEESWLRQPRETGAAFFAFCHYRDFGGDRSIRKAIENAKLPEKRCGIWRAWSNRYSWRKRCEDYDTYLDKIRRQERETAFREVEKV